MIPDLPGDTTTPAILTYDGSPASYQSTLEIAGDSDWIALDVAQSGPVVLHVDGLGDPEAVIGLYDADGVLIAEVDEDGGFRYDDDFGDIEIYFNLTADLVAGTSYYLGITARNGSATGDYTVSVFPEFASDATSTASLAPGEILQNITSEYSRFYDFISFDVYENSDPDRVFLTGLAADQVYVLSVDTPSADITFPAQAATLDILASTSGFVPGTLTPTRDVVFRVTDPDGLSAMIETLELDPHEIRLEQVYENLGSDLGEELRSFETRDVVTGLGGSDTIYTGDQADTIDAGSGNDRVYAGIGHDRVYGGVGHDLLQGAPGYDLLSGQNGVDTLLGQAGADTLYGGAGNDELHGGINNDSLDGGDDDDLLFGSNGADTLYGDTFDRFAFINGFTDGGDDTLYGNAGPDALFGWGGDDVLHGGINNDALFGEDGNDLLNGNPGADLLLGGEGDDTLYGNAGMDSLNGGYGDDDLFGGIGRDSFTFFNNDGADTVHDFQNNIDTIEIEAALLAEANPVVDDLRDYAAFDANGNLVLDFGGGNSVTFNNVGTLNAILDDVVIV